MGNLFRAHIFKDRQVGNREEVTLKLFNKDGSPLDLAGGGSGPDPDPDPTPGGSTSGGMVFKGVWNPANNYKTNDVVLYNPGSGMRTYIFTQDHTAGIPAFNDVNGNPVTKFWDPNVGHVDLVLGLSSYSGSGGMVNGFYDMFMLKINATGGQVALRATDTLGGMQDLGAYLWHQKVDGTWEPVSSDDDSSGSGKPLIRYTIPGTHAMPGLYAYYLSKYSGGISDPSSFGTTRITVNGDNTAVIGSFADFPVTKTVVLGVGETISAT